MLRQLQESELLNNLNDLTTGLAIPFVSVSVNGIEFRPNGQGGWTAIKKRVVYDRFFIFSSKRVIEERITFKSDSKEAIFFNGIVTHLLKLDKQTL